MKKSLFLAAMAAVVLAGCSKNETSEIANNNNAIDFRPYVGGGLRSTLVPGSTLTDGIFTVVGYYTEAEDLTAAANQNFMHDDVTKTGNSFSYTDTKYWPSEAGHKVSFFAVHPKNAAVEVTPALKGAELPSVKYTVGTIADQIDLLTASKINQVKTETVTLPFTHALTKVGFEAQLADDYKNVTISDLAVTVKGQMAQSGDYAATATGTWAWTPGTATAATYVPALKTVTLTKTAQPITADGNYLLLIPQRFTEGAASIEVTYKVTTTDSGLEDARTATIDLSKVEGVTWEAGKAVTYQLSIALDAVNFTATVDTWE